jgi:hypothetical protein
MVAELLTLSWMDLCEGTDASFHAGPLKLCRTYTLPVGKATADDGLCERYVKYVPFGFG